MFVRQTGIARPSLKRSVAYRAIGIRTSYERTPGGTSRELGLRERAGVASAREVVSGEGVLAGIEGEGGIDVGDRDFGACSNGEQCAEVDRESGEIETVYRVG